MRRLVGVLLGLAILSAAVPVFAADEGEAKTGRQIYESFVKRGEIVQHTRYNAVVDPIAARITAVAQPQYGQPLQYYVIKGKAVNAFAVPGGYMFIYQGLIDAVQTKDELAGVMCHETSHTLHHDATNLQKTAVQRAIGLTVAGLLVPGAGTAVRLLGNASDFQMAHFSRHVESAADLTGADLCIAAGYNPHGLVWMMERFQQLAGPRSLEMLSNHPRDDHRISDLLDHFKAAPQTFANLRTEIAWGTPIAAAGDGSKAPEFPFVVCPRSTPDDHRPAENFAAWWGGLEAVKPFISATPVSAPAARIVDTIEFPHDVQWYRFREDLGGIVTGYDPAAHALATCADDASGARMDIVEGVAPPEERLPTVDTSSLTTHAGIALGAPLGALIAAYGPAAAPQHLADGRDVYQWERVAASGDRWSARVALRDEKVVGYELRTRVAAVATPDPQPTNPASAK